MMHKIKNVKNKIINFSSKDLLEARKNSLSSLEQINWTDRFFRKDIGWRAIKKNESNRR